MYIFICYYYIKIFFLIFSRKTTIQAIEAKLKSMEHSDQQFEVNNEPVGTTASSVVPTAKPTKSSSHNKRDTHRSRPPRRNNFNHFRRK